MALALLDVVIKFKKKIIIKRQLLTRSTGVFLATFDANILETNMALDSTHNATGTILPFEIKLARATFPG